MLYFSIPQIVEATFSVDLNEVSSVSVHKNSHGVWLIFLIDGQYCGTPYLNYLNAGDAIRELKAHGFSEACETLKSELKAGTIPSFKWKLGK